MKVSGYFLIGIGLILFFIGLFLTVGVLVFAVPYIGWFSWILMSLGGLMIVIGIILAIFGR